MAKSFLNKYFFLSLFILLCTIQAWGGTVKYTLNLESSPSDGGYVMASKSSSASFSGVATTSSVYNTASAGLTALNSKTITLYAYAKAGDNYSFAGWSESAGGSITSTANPMSSTSGKLYGTKTETKTLYAIFKSKYSVKFNGNGSTSGSMSNQAFVYDAAQDLTANDFSRIYTVTYNANGGTCGTPSANAAYTFAGWATTEDGDVAHANQANVKNLTATAGDTFNLYAKWNSASVTLPAASKTDGSLFDGWYIGEDKVGNAGEQYIPTSNVTLTAHWVSKYDLEMTSSVPTTISVGDEISDAFAFVHADNPTNAISELLIDAINSGSGRVVTYDAVNNKLIAENAGTAKITFTQASTTMMNASTEEFTVTVAKHVPTFTQLTNNTVVGRAIALADFVSSTNTATAMTLSNTDGKVNVAGNVIYTTQAASAQIVVSQAENYYWVAKNETLTLTVAEPEPTCVTGDTPANGTPYYIYSASAKKYLSDDNTLTALPEVTWTTSFSKSGSEQTGTMVSAGGKYLGVNRSGNSKSSLDPAQFTAYSNAASQQSAATNTTTLWVKTQTNNQYSFNCNLVYKDAAFLSSEQKGDIYIKANDAALGTTTQANANPTGYWMFVSETQAAFQVAIAKAYSYLSEKTVSAAVKNMLVQAIGQNNCESAGDYPAKTAALETALDVYDAYAEVHTFIANSLADQEGKDAAYAELDNNRITRSALEEVKQMVKKTAFVTYDDALTIYVGDALPDFFNFDDCSPFGPDFSAGAPVVESIDSYNTSSPNPGVVFSYDVESNTLTACNAGTATITFSQAATAEYYAKDISLTLTVVKRTPELSAWDMERVGTSRTYRAFVRSTNMLSDFSFSYSGTSIEAVSQPSAGILSVTTNAGKSASSVTVSQPENYQFSAVSSQTFDFTPKDINDHLPMALSSSNYTDFFVADNGCKTTWANNGMRVGSGDVWSGATNWNDRYFDLTFTGIPDKLSFSYERSTSIATGCNWYVQQSADGETWTNVWTKDGSNSGTVSNLQLALTTRYLRFSYSGNYGGYFRGITVSERSYFTVSTSSLDWGTMYVGEMDTKSFVFSHANAASETTVTAPEHFAVSLDGSSYASSVTVSASGKDLYGEQTIYVRYNTSDENTCTGSVLTVSDGVHTETVLLSGTTERFATEVVTAPTVGDLYIGLPIGEVLFSSWLVRTTTSHEEVAGEWRVMSPASFDAEGFVSLSLLFVPTNEHQYSSCSQTTPLLEVTRRRIIYDDEHETHVWDDVANWENDLQPSEYDDVVITRDVTVQADVEVHGLTIAEDATLTVQSGHTLVVGDGNSGSQTPGNLVVEEGAKVVLGSGTLKVNDFIIESALGDLDNAATSGQVTNTANLQVNGDAYIDIKLDPTGVASEGWYAFTVPFPVSIKDGVYFGSTKLTNERDYAIMQYQGDVRATGAYGWIKSHKVDNILHPGQFYLIGLADTDYATLRFKKTDEGSIVSAISSVPLNEYAATGEGLLSDAGWNGLGNPSLSYQNVSFGGNKVQVYYHASNSFDVLTTNDHSFVVGSPFFAKSTGASDVISFVTATEGTLGMLRAPSRQVSTDEFNVRLGKTPDSYVDQLYLSASETALTSYEEGHDLVKASFGTPKVAQIAVDAYGMQLCDAELPFTNGEALFPLSLTAPAAGEYMLYVEAAPDNQQMFLLYNGQPIWNLTQSPYSLSLIKGSTLGYSLLVQYKAPSIATDIQGVESAPSAEKVFLDGHVYILKDEKTYDAVGRLVQ